MKPLDFSTFFHELEHVGLAKLVEPFSQALERSLSRKDGNWPRWLAALESLPESGPVSIELNAPAISISAKEKLNDGQRSILQKSLGEMCPWRKGPFSFFDLFIDSEWRSDMKWNRLIPFLSDIQGAKILDVGCGNGYHMLRMLGCGAAMVVGADPSLLFLAQFSSVKKYVPELKAHLLPLGIEELPETQIFDLVFAMGVLYHRRSPFDFLRQLKMQLRPGGELILETLVIEGDENAVLVPKDRYARMKNVWFIPSPAAMVHWLEKAGFLQPRLLDICPTTIEEQRATAWMTGESLQECLAEEDDRLTVEGYPRPVRAIFSARR